MKSENLSIEDNNSNNLLVTFGGIKQGMGMPVYEFYNVLKTLSCDKVFIKDIYQAWYHKGINQEVKNIFVLKDLLQCLIKRKSYENVVFIGNSMGGYGAILFGVFLNVDRVIAFSPQTFINRTNRIWYNDRRWYNEISNIYINNRNQSKYYNLKPYLRNGKYLTQIDVYYSTKDGLDTIHAERLRKQKNVNLFSYNQGNHNLIKVLRDEGELIRIISNSFNKK